MIRVVMGATALGVDVICAGEASPPVWVTVRITVVAGAQALGGAEMKTGVPLPPEGEGTAAAVMLATWPVPALASAAPVPLTVTVIEGGGTDGMEPVVVFTTTVALFLLNLVSTLRKGHHGKTERTLRRGQFR